ncbi:MAG: insulinase family protein, partial [Planctomycetales bacterium]|nr:insulinase family protein [Planctomycetales bacterium]
QAKNKLCAHIILSSERASSRLFAVGNNWIKRQQYQTVRDVVDAYQRVTLTDIRRILDQYSLINHTTVAISPEKVESPY